MVARLAIATENKNTEETESSVDLPSDLVGNQGLDRVDWGPHIDLMGSVATFHDISSRIGEENV